MAYNLSPRWKVKRHETSDILGPSYYHLMGSAICKENYAPFLTTTDRKTFTGQTQWTAAVYNVQIPKRIIGGSSMKNREKREIYHIKSYEPRSDVNICRPSEKPRRPRRLYVCRVPFYNMVKGPSVPSKIDENGYHVDENDILTKNPPDVCDTTLGPAFYCVKGIPNMTKQMYGGCRWSASNAPRRTIEAANDYPGPGSYDIGKREPTEAELLLDEQREMARALCYVPRYLEQRETQVLHEDIPAPNRYNLQGKLLIPQSNRYSTFNTSSKRSSMATKDSGPGPGDYELGSTLKVKWVSQGESSFVYKMPRFKSEKAAKLLSPGPGSYEIKRLCEKTQRLNYNAVPFNISSKRLIDKYDNGVPGPNQYSVGMLEEVEEPDETVNKTKITSTFKSRTARFPKLEAKEKSAEPASYNITEAYRRMRGRKDFAARVKGVGFSNSEQRVLFKIEDGPCPCTQAHTEMPFKGYYISGTPRLESYDNGVPGPGSYQFVKTIESSVYKPTFNIRLKENQIGSKLRLAPNKTKDAWNRERKKRRQLRAFHHNEIQIMESWMDL